MMSDSHVPFFIVERGILESSIMALDLEARWMMVVLIEIASEPGRAGKIDMILPVLANRAGMTVEQAARAMEQLSRPDPNSRSTVEDGRRVVLLDPNRNWGWRLVNWEAKDINRKRLLATARQQRHRALPSVTERDETSPLSREGKEIDTKGKDIPRKKSGDRFAPPTLTEVTEFIKENKFTVDPIAFFNKHEANGWTLKNGKRMKSWQATIAYWQTFEDKRAQPTPPPEKPKDTRYFGPPIEDF